MDERKMIYLDDAINALERKKDKKAKGDIGGFYNKIVQNDIDALMQLPPAQSEFKNGLLLTPNVLADALMEERIRGELKQDITFEKDIIRDVKCRLTVSIRDHRPCYCGAELREVWRESEVSDANSD